jgi:hypothetical protein
MQAGQHDRAGFAKNGLLLPAGCEDASTMANLASSESPLSREIEASGILPGEPFSGDKTPRRKRNAIKWSPSRNFPGFSSSLNAWVTMPHRRVVSKEEK